MTADWYVMRSTGIVALVLLTAALALGIAGANRWAPGGAPRFVTAAIHRGISLLSVVFVALHVVTALVDSYASVSLPDVVAPTPTWLGIGAVSFDLTAALIVTSLLRRRIGYRVWRAIHWLAYLSWPTAFAHSVGLGSDGPTAWFQAVALASLATVVGAVIWRVLLPPRRLDLA